MTKFHAVMTDECGGEFGVTIQAADRNAAYDQLREDYPESSVAQLESPQDTRDREAAIYARVSGDDYDYGEDY